MPENDSISPADSTQRGKGRTCPINCLHCGKRFLVYASQAERARYCSTACQHAGYGANLSEQTRASLRKPKGDVNTWVDLTCEYCKASFKINQGASATRRYCTRQCFQEAVRTGLHRPHARAKQHGAGSEDICAVCGTPYPRRFYGTGGIIPYCSRACAYKAHRETRVCETCGEAYERNTNSRRSPRYCSRACRTAKPCHVCGTTVTGRNRIAEEGISYCSRRCAAFANGTVPADFNYMVRGFAGAIRRLGKLACERCGQDNADGLIVHHRDRDRSNNRDSNLETLCGTCHTIEHRGEGSRLRRAIEVAHRLAAHLDRKGA